MHFQRYKKAYRLFFRATFLLVGGLVFFILAKKISAYYQVEIPDFIYALWMIVVIGTAVGKYGGAMNEEWNKAKTKSEVD